MAYINAFLTNRSFYDVDSRFCLALGDEIKKRAEKNPLLTICDIPCGTQANALADLRIQYPQATLLGLDYQLEREIRTLGTSLVRGDLFDIPFEGVSDVTYCAYILANVHAVDLDEHRSTLARATFQLAKTLRKGGVAFVDESVYTGRQHYVDMLVEEILHAHPDFSDQFKVSNNPELGHIGNYMVITRAN